MINFIDIREKDIDLNKGRSMDYAQLLLTSQILKKGIPKLKLICFINMYFSIVRNADMEKKQNGEKIFQLVSLEKFLNRPSSLLLSDHQECLI